MSGQVASMHQQNIFGNQLGLNMPQIGMGMDMSGQNPYMLAAPRLEVPAIGVNGLPNMAGGMEMDANFGMQPVSLDMNNMGLGGNFVFYPEPDAPLVPDFNQPVVQEEEICAPGSPEKKTRDATVSPKKKEPKKSAGFCCF